MTRELPTFPLILVFRTLDTRLYLFLEMALVNPGHYVGWGEIRYLGCSDIETEALNLVTSSLSSFSTREGTDKARQARLKGYGPMYVTYDLVEVRMLPEGLFEFIPCRREDGRHKRINTSRFTLGTNTSASDFAAALNRGFKAAQLE